MPEEFYVRIKYIMSVSLHKRRLIYVKHVIVIGGGGPYKGH